MLWKLYLLYVVETVYIVCCGNCICCMLWKLYILYVVETVSVVCCGNCIYCMLWKLYLLYVVETVHIVCCGNCICCMLWKLYLLYVVETVHIVCCGNCICCMLWVWSHPYLFKQQSHFLAPCMSLMWLHIRCTETPVKGTPTTRQVYLPKYLCENRKPQIESHPHC